MTTPNPLQELAARLRQELIAIAKEKAGDDAAKLSFAGVLINAITPALGTLLQAEREAERKLTLEAAAKWFDERMIKTHGYPSYIGDTLRSLSMDAQFATGDASALAAVVQRETEKLREALKWTLSICDDSVIFKSAFGDEICASCDTRLDMNGTKAPHKVDCPYVAAKAALQ